MGIIVVGVLIALGAEQAVEAWHWRAQAAEARTALRNEIGQDNLPQAYARLALARCLLAKLDQLDAAFAAHVDRSHFLALAKTYKPPNRSWDDEAWKAVTATGVLSHGGAAELIRWSTPYRIIVRMGPLNQAEADDRIELSAIQSAPGSMTLAEADRVTVALNHLRSREKGMEITSLVLIEDAREAGVVMTRSEQRQVLADLRSQWGNCVAAPRIAALDVSSQSDLSVNQATAH
ncbi:MAG TPA: hypothetical protein VK192_09215 [Sphingomicrobium sp.]|nr:hypothetical protein [Sphingomicrobium sp.]